MSAVPPIQSWGFGPSFGTSFSFTSSGPITNGSLIVVSVFLAAGLPPGTLSVSDSSGNTYTVDGQGGGGFPQVYLASTTVTSGGGSTITILVNTPGNTGSTRVFASEYASALSPRFDAATSFFNTTPTTNSVTTTNANELLISLTLWESTVTPSADTGYTIEDAQSFVSITTLVQDSVAGAAGVQTITLPAVGSSGVGRDGIFAAYRVASTTNASVNLSGISSVSAVTLTSEKGTANPTPAGATTASAVGTLSDSGTANAPLSGTVTASSLTNVTTSTSSTHNASITVFGVFTASVVGSLAPGAGANASIGSNATISVAGTAMPSVGVSAFLTGVNSQPRVALLVETGSANVFLFGVTTLSIVRLPIGSTPAHGTAKVTPSFSGNASVVGVSGTTGVM
jgi:hypothetical protein